MRVMACSCFVEGFVFAQDSFDQVAGADAFVKVFSEFFNVEDKALAISTLCRFLSALTGFPEPFELNDWLGTPSGQKLFWNVFKTTNRANAPIVARVARVAIISNIPVISVRPKIH